MSILFYVLHVSEYSAYTMVEDLPINEDDYCEKAKAEFYRALTR